MTNLTRISPVLGLIVAMGSGTAATAQQIGEQTVSAGVSTFGLNAEVAYQFDPVFRVRGLLMGVPSFDELSDSFEEDGTEYDYDASIGALGAMIDYYPTTTAFRVSGGLILHQTQLEANAALAAGNAFTLDDGTEITSGTATLESEFEKTVSPIITMGYDYRFGENWVLSGEAGAIYTGGISIDASSTNAQLQAEIDDDQDIRDARQDAEDVTFYPYLSVTVGYRF